MERDRCADSSSFWATVNARFAAHPGALSDFAWPVTREQALDALARFVAERLPRFGRWQDAMWPGEAWLWHSHLSAALNLKLLNPREVVAAAEAAYYAGRVPLASAEGFIRQILGWRECVRGIYWTQMPGYLERNALGAREPLPEFYWTGRTPMTCLSDAIGQTLRYGYAHHIQRLMVTGLYALLLGVDPKAVHAWYLAVYVDAVEWVELPNTLGMSQAADGGLMASKPYIAGGMYIQRMSGGSLCARCKFDPNERTGRPCLSLYHALLGLPDAARANIICQSPYLDENEKPRTYPPGGAQAHCHSGSRYPCGQLRIIVKLPQPMARSAPAQDQPLNETIFRRRARLSGHRAPEPTLTAPSTCAALFDLDRL